MINIWPSTVQVCMEHFQKRGRQSSLETSPRDHCLSRLIKKPNFFSGGWRVRDSGQNDKYVDDQSL